MILFIFEGTKREPALYKTIEKLYFPKDNDNIICSFGNHIYALYQALQQHGEGADIVLIMRELLQQRGDTTLSNVQSNDISEIYLFFDYDFQNSKLTLQQINKQIQEMLTIFNDETNNGKLYINYPMIESIRYTKELPDANYINYTVTRNDCKNFKRLANNFSSYSNLDHIIIAKQEKYQQVEQNWLYLEQMNVCKANLLVSGQNAMPQIKSNINQSAIFQAQLEKYINPTQSVAILNSFPIFIFDYFK